MEVAVKAERLRFGKDRVIFKGGHAAVQLGIGAVTRKIGGVLAHEGKKEGVRSEFVGKCAENVYRIGALCRQDEMAHDRAAQKHAVRIELRSARLTQHFTESRKRDWIIVLRARITRRELRAEIFEIGQIDVHKPIQTPQGFHALIAAAVVDHGNVKLWAHLAQHVGKLIGVLRGRDEIDVVRALVPQTEHQGDQLFRIDLLPQRVMADLMILTEYAT